MERVSDVSIRLPIPRVERKGKERKGKGRGKQTFVNENETQVVAGGVFLVDFAECGSEVKTA